MPRGKGKGKAGKGKRKKKPSKAELGARALSKNLVRMVRDLNSLTKVEVVIHIDSTNAKSR